MKTIGLIGGISWQSTLVYYKTLNELVIEQLGHPNSCKCLIHSVQFGEVKKLQYADDWDSLNSLMAQAAISLQKGGANLLMIGANTMHLTAPYISQQISIPIIHIVDAVGESIVEKGLAKVGLLGTQFTMQKDFYKTHLKTKFNVDTIVPEGDDFETVNSIIYNELIKGIINETSKQNYLQIMQRLIERGAQGIILGCTEIPLLVQQQDCNYPVFDTTMIHAKAAVQNALNHKI